MVSASPSCKPPAGTAVRSREKERRRVCAAMLGVGVLGTAVLHARAAHSTAHSFAPLCLHSVASVHAPLMVRCHSATASHRVMPLCPHRITKACSPKPQTAPLPCVSRLIPWCRRARNHRARNDRARNHRARARRARDRRAAPATDITLKQHSFARLVPHSISNDGVA